MPDWTVTDAYTRLLAAVVASGNKIDYHTVAAYYGRGATYNSIEARFRHVRADAANLKSEYEAQHGSDSVPLPSAGTSSAGKKAKTTAGKDKVVSGRVEKSANGKKAGGGRKGKVAKVGAEDDGVDGEVKGEDEELKEEEEV